MAVSPSDLRTIPLFQDITDEHLNELIGVLERVEFKEGEELFKAGEKPSHLVLLVDGEVSLREEGETRFRLRPIAPIGELGALTGLRRNTTAVATQQSAILRVSTATLMQFFESHGDVAFPFYHNLLRVVADKIRRDMRRLTEMRANIIRTQKAMKRLREVVLESEDTVVSKPIFETLEELIEHNRRWNYMVEPAHTLKAAVRLDDGTLLGVHEISANWLKLPRQPALKASAGSHFSGVLVIPTGELPISGTVDGVDEESVTIQLDLLIRSYHSVLEEYLTRVQMLDFVV
jgi:CRP/FNR family transcriptional regulator, cyclic AMP receptor protein